MNILDSRHVSEDLHVFFDLFFDDFWLFNDDFLDNGDLDLFDDCLDNDEGFILLINFDFISFRIVVDVMINFLFDDMNDGNRDLNFSVVLLFDDLFDFLDDLNLLLDVLDDLLWHFSNVLNFLFNDDINFNFLDGDLDVLMVNFG